MEPERSIRDLEVLLERREVQGAVDLQSDGWPGLSPRSPGAPPRGFADSAPATRRATPSGPGAAPVVGEADSCG
jgi:hypothetical protein